MRNKLFIDTEHNLLNADGEFINKTLNKWAYDSNNKLTITRTINNTNNAYTQDELNALGKTATPNTYLVNKLIPYYDSNNPYLTKDIQMEIKPWTLSLYSDCK